MSQRAARTALAALRKAGWLEELPGRKNGRQARYRLLNRARISTADGQRIGEFVWPPVPHAAQDDRAAIRELLEKGQLPKKVGGQINIHLHFEAGSVGIVMAPPATSPMLQVIDQSDQTFARLTDLLRAALVEKGVLPELIRLQEDPMGTLQAKAEGSVAIDVLVK